MPQALPRCPQQLYRELGLLEADGFVDATVVEQSKRPNKRVYSLTALGRQQLREFTRTAPKPTAIRDELLVQMASLPIGDSATIIDHVREFQASSQLKLQQYKKSRQRLLAGRTELEYLNEAPEVGRYLTLLRGLSFEKENIRWSKSVISALESRSR